MACSSSDRVLGNRIKTHINRSTQRVANGDSSGTVETDRRPWNERDLYRGRWEFSIAFPASSQTPGQLLTGSSAHGASKNLFAFASH